MIQEIESTRNFRAGYQIHYGRWRMDEGEPWTPLRWATTPNGNYLGDPVWAYRLVAKRGIKPELKTSHSNVCSIGFCETEQKWYGWSHRAIYGFGIGDTVEEGDCAAESGWTDEYLAEHPEENTALPVGFVARTLEDAKRMAIAFADSVS